MATRDERGSSLAKVGSKLVSFPFSENYVAEWLAERNQNSDPVIPFFTFEFVCDANHTGADFTKMNNSAILRILYYSSMHILSSDTKGS